MLKLSKQILIQKEAQIAFQWQREKSKLGLPSFPKVLEKSPFSSPLKGNLQLPSFSLRGTWAHIFQRSNQTIKLEGLWNNCILFFPSKVVSLPQRQVNVNWVRATLQGACWFESQVEGVDQGLLSTDVLNAAQRPLTCTCLGCYCCCNFCNIFKDFIKSKQEAEFLSSLVIEDTFLNNGRFWLQFKKSITLYKVQQLQW